jgi:hypothetical protein
LYRRYIVNYYGGWELYHDMTLAFGFVLYANGQVLNKRLKTVWGLYLRSYNYIPSLPIDAYLEFNLGFYLGLAKPTHKFKFN